MGIFLVVVVGEHMALVEVLEDLGMVDRETVAVVDQQELQVQIVHLDME